jgi:hypothetical protein
MPAIRLADIPNAGPQAAAASAAMIGAPSVPRYQVNPEVAQLGGAAMMDSRSTRNAAQSMLTQTLELDAFSQEARAMGKFADSIGGIGDVAMKWGEKFAEAKDYADINRAETLLAVATQKQKADQATLPLEKWGESFARHQEETKRALAEIKFSNNAAAKFQPYLDNWTLKSEVALNAESRIKQLELSKTDIKANALRLAAESNFEASLSAFKGGVDKGVFTQEEFDKFAADIRDNEIRAAESMQTDRITADLMTDWTVAKQNLNEYVKSSGDAKDDARINGAYGEMPMSKVRRLMAQVDQQGRITETNNYNTLAQAIDSNTPIRDANGNEFLITDKDKLNKALETFKVTGTESKARLERLISDNVPYNSKDIAEVNARLATYDPATDKDLGDYATLQNEIAAKVPKQLRPLLNDRLAQSVKKFNADGTLKSASEKWQGDMIRHVLDLGKAGILGDQGLDSDGKNIVDVQKNNKYWQDVYKVQQGLEDWFQNPANKDKTPADAQAFRDSLIKSGIEESSKNARKKQTSNRSSYVDSISAGAYGAPTPKPTPPPSTDAIQKAKEAKDKALGKVTSYNFPNDPYSDTNSRNRIGAWNNRLDENSLAISPDIERKFKAAGIGKGDAVELTLADGSTVIRTWDDRTMQDAQAIKKFGKPLTGRFDFHSPGGKQKNDGMAVVSFRKAPTA